MTMRSTWVEVEGLRMHALTSVPAEGDERLPLVLVHGAAVSSEHMRPAAEALAPHIPVHVPDLPGHGRSDDPPAVLDAGGHAESLAAWMRASGLARAHVLGNSFGCQVIAELAVRHPDVVERAVLQGPTVDPAAHGVRQLGRWFVNAWREGATQPQMTFKQWGKAGFRVFFRTLRYMDEDRIEEKLPRMTVPTLVVRGTRDPIIPQRWAEEAVRLLPHGRLAVIHGETHTIVVSAPEKLAALVVPFLAESLPAPAGGSPAR